MDNQDLLSEIFSTLRLTGDLYFQAELRGGFSIEIPSEQRHIRFHLVRQGHCCIASADDVVTELREGDIAVVPNGAAQVLSGAPDAVPVPLADIVGQGALQQGVLRYGAGDRTVRLLCGFCQFDEAIDHPVLVNLPGVIVVRREDLGAEPWVSATLRLLSMETDLNAQGTTGILTRLLEIFFIQVVRRMTARPDERTNGFMAALTDRQLSKALMAIHKEPHVAWKIRDLAKLSGMSRARFAERFNAVVGVPPIGYLTSWRLMKARSLLTGSDLDMAEIAARCGYASVPSFSSRFKRMSGIGPGAFRRLSRSG